MNSKSKQEIVKSFQMNDKDTGSAQVQAAVLTARIQELTEHLKKFVKDFASKRSMMNMVNKRKRLLRYVETRDAEGYKSLIKKLNMRK